MHFREAYSWTPFGFERSVFDFGSPLANRRLDIAPHETQVHDDLPVFEPDDTDAEASKQAASGFIGEFSLFGEMALSVQLDSEPQRGSIKIDDENPDPMLTAKLHPSKPPAS